MAGQGISTLLVCHIGDGLRLRPACTSVQSCESLHCSHILESMGVDEGSHIGLSI